MELFLFLKTTTYVYAREHNCKCTHIPAHRFQLAPDPVDKVVVMNSAVMSEDIFGSWGQEEQISIELPADSKEVTW